MLLKPTGRCFDDALDFLEIIAASLSAEGELFSAAVNRLGRYTVVHGICTQPIGTPYAHAWVEEGGSRVWQGGIVDGRRVFYALERNQFYSDRDVIESTRYTVREALKENWDSNHYGPWVEKYRELCRTEGAPINASPLEGQRVVEVLVLE